MGIRYFLLWLPMILIAFANAMIRQLIFIKHVSELSAHQLSTITLILLCAAYVWFVYPLLRIGNSIQTFTIGFIWVLLTVAFEFSLGRLTNKSWHFLFQQYNILAGNIWVIFLLCLFMMPFLAYKLRPGNG
jgi:hypothetical protein